MYQLLHEIETTLDDIFMYPPFWPQKIDPLHLSGFSQKFPICGLLYFCRFEFLTLTPNRFKNQTNEIFKPLVHNYNHQQGKGFLNKKLLLSIVEVLT